MDIRDTVNYQAVKSTYNLGPNGAIVTSLNLFCTKLDQFLAVLDKRKADFGFCLVDTPGQIEVFTWSASGPLLTDALALHFPTTIVFVVDAMACRQHPATFISNMLYATSVLYKFQLPLIVAFNKTDLDPTCFQTVQSWMQDYETFQHAFMHNQLHSASYADDMVGSMALYLEEFYKTLNSCAVSAETGTGLEELVRLINASKAEYQDLVKSRSQQKKETTESVEEQQRKQQDVQRLMQDLRIADPSPSSGQRE